MRKVLSLIPGTLLALAIAFAAKWLEGLEKRRNTVCISNFSNRRIGGKDPPKCEDAIVRCCHRLNDCLIITIAVY